MGAIDVINLVTDCNAVANGDEAVPGTFTGTNNAGALDAALSQSQAAGGKPIYVPPGKYRLQGAALQAFGDRDVMIFGAGSASQLLLDYTADQMLTIQDAYRVDLSRLTLRGRLTDTVDDCRIGLYITDCHDVMIDRVNFIGIRASQAVCLSYQSRIRYVRCRWLACKSVLPVVAAVASRDFEMGWCLFEDTGVFAGTTYNKTGTPNWVGISDVVDADGIDDPSSGVVHIHDSKFDEGSPTGARIRLDPTATFLLAPEDNTRRYDKVVLERIHLGINASGSGASIKQARRVNVDGTTVSDWGSGDRYIYDFVDAGDVVLRDVLGRTGANAPNKIRADSATNSLRLEHCLYQTLESSAKHTEVIL